MSQLQLLLLLTAAAAWLAPAEGADALVTIDGSIVLAETHPTSFLSFSFDTTALFGVERTAIPFSSTALQKMSAHLAPAYLRLGGSLEDGTAYNVSGDLEPLDPPVNMTMVYLNSSKWDEVVSFTTAAQLDLVFGLNAAIGRQSADPNAHLAWNASNIQSLLNYVVAKGQNLTAVELGNEVNVFNCSSGKANMSATQLAEEHLTLSSMLAATLPGTEIWGTDSSITGDKKGQCWSWYGNDIWGFNRDWLASPLRPQDVVSALTWHYYPQCSMNNSCDADCMTAQMLTYEYQTRLWAYDKEMRALRDQYAPGKRLVLGETASYWAGGVPNASNRFVSGFWGLNQLGYLAAQGYWVQVRQDIAGGSYGLLDLVQDGSGGPVTGFVPNPDYWSTVLWKRLIGPSVLATNALSDAPNATGVWGWAFCTAKTAQGWAPGDATVVLLNFNNESVSVPLHITAGQKSGANITRAAYLLSPPEGGLGLHSQDVVLNSNSSPLRLNADYSLPAFEAALQNGSEDVQMPAFTYGFYHLRGAGLYVC